MAKTILRKTPQKVAVKVAGGAGADTIALATDLLHTTEVVDGTPAVNILAFHWTGTADGVAVVSRNGTTIATLTGSSAGELLFNDSEFVDNVNNTNDIVVTITGTHMEVWMLLRKADGYTSKIETAQFGSYDNETVVGS